MHGRDLAEVAADRDEGLAQPLAARVDDDDLGLVPAVRALPGAGKLKLDELITRRDRIEEAPQAFDDRAQARNARGVIVFD